MAGLPTDPSAMLGIEAPPRKVHSEWVVTPQFITGLADWPNFAILSRPAPVKSSKT
jgi:hypothetical protein